MTQIVHEYRSPLSYQHVTIWLTPTPPLRTVVILERPLRRMSRSIINRRRKSKSSNRRKRSSTNIRRMRSICTISSTNVELVQDKEHIMFYSDTPGSLTTLISTTTEM